MCMLQCSFLLRECMMIVTCAINHPRHSWDGAAYHLHSVLRRKRLQNVLVLIWAPWDTPYRLGNVSRRFQDVNKVQHSFRMDLFIDPMIYSMRYLIGGVGTSITFPRWRIVLSGAWAWFPALWLVVRWSGTCPAIGTHYFWVASLTPLDWTC